MAAFVEFDEFKGDLLKGVHDFTTHAFKAVLSDVAPSIANNTVLTDITQIAGGNGYVTDGVALTGVTLTEPVAGTWRFDCDDFKWTASGGNIGPFRYVVIFNDTSVGDRLCFMHDRGSSVTIADPDEYQVQVNASGVAELT